jgi:hypothetical protein
MKLGMRLSVSNIKVLSYEYVPIEYQTFYTSDNKKLITADDKDFNVKK